MTPTSKQKQDSRLAMWVAGSVVAGAICIAMLAGFAAQRDSGKESESRTSSRPDYRAPVAPHRAPPVAVIPASLETGTLQENAELPQPSGTAAFAVDPGENFVARGLECYETREFDHAVAYFEAEITERPQRPWTHYMLGLALWKSGRLDEAAAAMEESAGLGSFSIKTHVNLSRIRNDQGQFDAALEAARAALAVEPGDPSALFLEGRSLLNRGQVEAAIRSLQASLAVDPENGYVHNMLGLALMRAERLDDAVSSFERAAAVGLEVAYVQNNLGMALELSGRREQAVAAYRRGTEIDTGHERVAANLARLEPAIADGSVSQ